MKKTIGSPVVLLMIGCILIMLGSVNKLNHHTFADYFTIAGLALVVYSTIVYMQSKGKEQQKNKDRPESE